MQSYGLPIFHPVRHFAAVVGDPCERGTEPKDSPAAVKLEGQSFRHPLLNPARGPPYLVMLGEL